VAGGWASQKRGQVMGHVQTGPSALQLVGTRSCAIRRGASLKVGSPMDADSMTLLFVQLMCICGPGLNAKRRTPNAERRTFSNAKRQTPNAPALFRSDAE
jgi:hypothetical protein